MTPTNNQKILVFLGFSLALVLLTLLCYWPGVHGPFIFDDLPNLVYNPAIQDAELNLSSLKSAALSSSAGFLNRPVAMFTFALNAAFFQLDTFSYKLVNIFIHIINGLIIFWLSLLLLRQYQDKNIFEKESDQKLRWLSLAVSALWLLHPVNLSAVLYVIQRMTELSALFVLLGLTFYVIGRRQIIDGRNIGLLILIISFIFGGLLSILCKENGVLFFPYALLFELFIFRLKTSSALATKFKALWFFLFLLPIIAGIIAAIIYFDRVVASYQNRSFSLGERLLTESRVIWFYIRLILIPDISKMGIYHDDFSISTNIVDPASTLFSILGIAGLAVAAIIFFRRLPVVSFAILWFFIGHSLESTIIPLEIIYEHRNYLPQYGILFALVYYVNKISVSSADGLLYRNISVVHIVFIAYLSLLGASTYVRASHWSSDFELTAHNVRNHPGSQRAHTSLAIQLNRAKQYDLAHRHFIEAALINTNDPKPLIRLSQNMYMATKTINTEVLTDLQARLENSRFNPSVLTTFSPLLMNVSKQPDLAEKLLLIYKGYIELHKTSMPSKWQSLALYDISMVYKRMGFTKVAIEYMEKSVAKKGLPKYYVDLAALYYQNSQPDKVISIMNKLKNNDIEIAKRDRIRLEKLADLMNKNNTGINNN